MRNICMEDFIERASREDSKLSKLVHSCHEAGIIVPSMLKSKLKEEGYSITFHKGPGEEAKEGKAKHGSWVLISKKEGTGRKAKKNVVGRAYSHDDADALLQAVYAMVKEEQQEVEEAK